jgi:hypothetical protein
MNTPENRIANMLDGIEVIDGIPSRLASFIHG